MRSNVGAIIVVGWALLLSALAVGCSDDNGDTGSPAGDVNPGDAGGDVVEGDDVVIEEGPSSCSSEAAAACDADPTMNWIAAGCHGAVLGCACFDQHTSPMRPPCAEQPCRDYAEEAECLEEGICEWRVDCVSVPCYHGDFPAPSCP